MKWNFTASAFGVALTMLLTFSVPPGAVSQGNLGVMEEGQARATFAEITDKFVRNMDLLFQKTPEPEAQEALEVVIGQAKGLQRFFAQGGGTRQRERLMKEKEALEKSRNISPRDLQKIKDLEQEIRKTDPDNMFGGARQQLVAAIRKLQSILDGVYTEDPERKDTLRITKQHLSIYLFCLERHSR